MKTRLLLTSALFLLLGALSYAQPLKQQGIFEILEEPTRDDLFGTTSTGAATVGRMVIQVDKRFLDRGKLDDIANWIKRGDLKFKSAFIRPRLAEITSGTQSVNGESVYYVLIVADMQLYGGLDRQSGTFEFSGQGKEWTMAPGVPITVTARKVAYLKFNVVDMPKYEEQVGTLDITVSGAPQPTLKIKRNNGNDVINTDIEINPELVRTAVGGKLLLTGVIAGNYTITAESPGFTPASLANFDLAADAKLPIQLTMTAQTVPLQLFVKDAKNKPLTGYDLAVRTKTLETVKSELDVPVDGFIVNLPAGEYVVTLKKTGFISPAPIDVKLEYSGSGTPVRRDVIMKTGGATPGVAAKPVSLTLEITDPNGKKLSGFTIEIKNEENGDVRNYPTVKGSAFKDRLMPGRYTATIRKSKYETATKSFVLEAGLDKRTETVSMRKGYSPPPKPTPNIRPKGGWGWLFLVASAGAAGYYLSQQTNESYGLPPALPSGQ
jgi:hypothetical protein